MWRAITLILLIYVTLDFADPNLPGALNFDLSQSVDGVQSHLRGQSPIAKGVTVPAPVFGQVMTAPKPQLPARQVSVIGRTTPVDLRARGLLSAVLASDSPEPH
jgi:hypothetical protein